MTNQLKNKFIKKILILIALIVFSVNLYAEDEKPKFKSMDPEFYETPTKFIIIVRCNDAQCKKLSVDSVSKNVYYYEINKKTGKSLKLKGKTLNNTHSLSFLGYYFDNKDLSYKIDLYKYYRLVISKMKGLKIIEGSIILEPKEEDVIFEEPVMNINYGGWEKGRIPRKAL